MMFKIMGCLMIFSGCCFLGIIKAASFTERRRELENTIEILRALNIDISYRSDTLAKVFRKTSETKNCWFSTVLGSCSRFLEQQMPLQKAYTDAVLGHSDSCPLISEDTSVIEDIVTGLGRSGKDGQRAVIEPGIERLKLCLDDAREKEMKQGRMYRALGIASGIVSAIMLI